MEAEIQRLKSEAEEAGVLKKRTEALETTLQAQREELDQRRSLADREVLTHRERADQLAEEVHVQRERANTQAERAKAVEDELKTLKEHYASEIAARQTLETRHSALLAEVSSQTRTLQSALADATQHTRAEEVLRLELAQAREELVAAREAQRLGEEKAQLLLAEQAETLGKLEASRMRGEDLESQIQLVIAEGQSVSKALLEAAKENEGQLRSQASLADRMLRDRIAEADGDRAVLEHRYSELECTLNTKTRELDEAKAEIAISRIYVQDSQSLPHEVEELKRRLANSEKLIAGFVAASSSLREAMVKSWSAAQGFVAASSKSTGESTIFGTAGSFARSPLSMEVIPQEDLSLSMASLPENSDPDTVLSALLKIDLASYSESINKTGSTIRRWQKQCKEYRERAKGKITFRNFGKGDLALFLPTRNNLAKAWAAFNGNLLGLLY